MGGSAHRATRFRSGTGRRARQPASRTI